MKKDIIKRLASSVGILVIVYFSIKSYDHFQVEKSRYGRKANDNRVMRGIPIIDDQLDPEERPKSEYDGIRWEGPKVATIDRKVVHTWKLVESTKEDGWLEEWDAFRYYLNDTTNLQLNLYFKISNDSTIVSGKLGMRDIRKESFDDYVEGKYPTYEWREIGKNEIDSIRNAWKL